MIDSCLAVCVARPVIFKNMVYRFDLFFNFLVGRNKNKISFHTLFQFWVKKFGLVGVKNIKILKVTRLSISVSIFMSICLQFKKPGKY